MSIKHVIPIQNLPEAELIQANAYYLSGKYPEAIAAYEDFARKIRSIKMFLCFIIVLRIVLILQASEEIDRETSFCAQIYY